MAVTTSPVLNICSLIFSNLNLQLMASCRSLGLLQNTSAIEAEPEVMDELAGRMATRTGMLSVARITSYDTPNSAELDERRH